MTYLYPELRLIIFAKAPVPGFVKTRLIPELGEAGAAELYRRLLTKTLQMASDSKVAPFELWVNEEHTFLSELAHKFDCQIRFQQGSDLGAKMFHALETTLGDYKSVVLIGSDCISLNKVLLHEAFDALVADSKVVLGPASDGGYVLIGMNEVYSSLFQDVKWSTETVLRETKNRLAELGVKYHELPVGHDIDLPEDLNRLDTELVSNLPKE